MAATPITNLTVGAVLLAGGGVATQETYESYVEDAHVQNMTSDLQMCQGDLIYESGFTRERFTQAAAADTVAQCKVTPGTALAVQVGPDGRNFTLTASSASAPHFDVVSDSAAGGGAEVIEKNL